MSIFKAISKAISSLFGGGSGQSSTISGTVGYNARLIESFKSDHRELVTIFGRFKTAVEQRDSTKARYELGVLGSALNSHTAKENRSFYAYMEDRHFVKVEVNKRVREFRAEMEGIKQQLGALVKTYVSTGKEEAPPLTAEEWTKLTEAVATLGPILVNRIQAEESELYTYYTE